MDQGTFERMLREEGYKAFARDIAPCLALAEHEHDWDTKGLVVRGSFTITCGGEPRTYCAGEIFELAAGLAHTERAGAEGAVLHVGRRTLSDH